MPPIDIITRSGYCSARRSMTAATLNRWAFRRKRVPPQPARGTSGSCSRRVRITVGGVAEVVARGLFARVEAMRPPSQRGVVVRLFRCQIGLLQILHVLPGEEVLLDHLLLQRQELGGAAGGRVAGVTGLANGSLGIEVIGVVLV